MLSEMLRQRATSYIPILFYMSLCLYFVGFCVLSVTRSLARAFSQSLLHAQHKRILYMYTAPRVLHFSAFILLLH